MASQETTVLARLPTKSRQPSIVAGNLTRLFMCFLVPWQEARNVRYITGQKQKSPCLTCWG